MASHTCPRCNYSTSKLSSFKTHLSKRDVCEVKNQDVPIDQLRVEYNITPDKTTHQCKNCEKSYSCNSALHYHSMKCKPDPNAKILALQNIIIQKDKIINDLREKLAKYEEWVNQVPM